MEWSATTFTPSIVVQWSGIFTSADTGSVPPRDTGLVKEEEDTGRVKEVEGAIRMALKMGAMPPASELSLWTEPQLCSYPPRGG
mmetsp:Transcript_78345/g.221565  ORF Transcript_78345/g.221565 Transcript_78345/m.221565 type:complete len:84 (+) Transcript_78345:713-964(+)